MKIGESVSAAICRAGLEPHIRRLRQAGFDCVDMQFFADTENGWFDGGTAAFSRRCEEFRRITEGCGMEISQTHGPWRHPPRDDTPADREERFDKMARSLEGTAILGAPCMVIHAIMPFGTKHPAQRSDPDAERFLELNRDFFRRLLDRAKGYGVVIALENLPFRQLLLSAPQDVLDFVKSFDSPYLRMCVDTGHAAVHGLGAGDVLRQVGKEYLACLHVHDNDGQGDRHWVPYTGVVDWADFSRALHEIGFDGTVSLETHVRSLLPGVPEALWDEYARSLAATARYLTILPE